MVVEIICIVASFLTTFFTLLFNYLNKKVDNKLDVQKLNIENFYKTKLDILYELMSSYGEIIADNNILTDKKFKSSLSKAMLVCNDKSKDAIKNILDYLNNRDYKSAFNKFQSSLDIFSSDIKETRENIEKSLKLDNGIKTSNK